MNRRRSTLYGISGVSLVVIAMVVGLGMFARNRAERDAQPTTTWEGNWEVPVVDGDHQSQTFVLAKYKTFRLRVGEDVSELHEGESVTVRWEPGKVFVNDIQVVPDPTPRKVYPVSYVMKMHGDNPGVREYIAEHRGEASEDEVATAAMEAWFAKKQAVLDQASERYREFVKTSPPRDAAEAAAEVIRSSGIADSVAVATGSPAESEAQELNIVYKGGRGRPGWLTGVSLRPWESDVAPPTVTAKRVYIDLIGEVDRLTYGENTLAVGFEGGSVIIEGSVIAKPNGAKE